ncbi:phosphate ABC transporter substrate-binding protein PstS [Oceanithermus profundus]|uniref:Phosphate-binding protein n=1 Tax=Oceanithermus profundus (strain DSM 14977 / NBRC 100410 / VKM B-2274 / 506) TaxID=670487 RepID=E4U9X3_OCEP5|nr:phosphate ABC transporter substrate-binding protein PstS [Oceanithermus profundus]ADR37287.1 phosphate ABC transporter substrate-binding protein, PhoT family [Oceanithermus profundus DSM 14977]
MKKLALTVLALTLGLALAQGVTLNGAGATFPFPLYAKYFSVYHKLTGVRVNYQSIGSGGGIRQLFSGTVHFGASDAPLSDAKLAEFEQKFGTQVIHVPTALGAVVPTYYLPGVTRPLNFSGPVLADIFLGKIRKWNDPALAALNPGVKLPPLPITVVRRSDGSGTTYIWTEYLAKVSPEWKAKVGVGKSVAWPTGLGGKGNEGVAGLVRQTPGAIGYNELIYAVQNKIAYGAVQNRAGKFVLADLASVRAAAELEDFPADTRVSITDTPAPEGYPIASFTWILVYRDLDKDRAVKSAAEAKALAALLDWIVHDGQRYNEALHYAALPEVAVRATEANLKRLRYRGEPVAAK